MKNIGFFLSENFPFLVVKFSIYLNRRVVLMASALMRRCPNAACSLGTDFTKSLLNQDQARKFWQEQCLICWCNIPVYSFRIKKQIQRAHDVETMLHQHRSNVMTLLRRWCDDDVVFTFMRRCLNFACPLGIHNSFRRVYKYSVITMSPFTNAFYTHLFVNHHNYFSLCLQTMTGTCAWWRT